MVLDRERVTIGRAETSDLAVPSDPELSRLHAILEPVGGGDWCVRDLASSNGTYVNGERVWSDRPLRHGDEIRIGRTRIIFRSGDATPDATVTRTAEPAPDVTRRERDVLVALCRPVLSADLFTEPASIRLIGGRDRRTGGVRVGLRGRLGSRGLRRSRRRGGGHGWRADAGLARRECGDWGAGGAQSGAADSDSRGRFAHALLRVRRRVVRRA